jgi:hypothetical protein
MTGSRSKAWGAAALAVVLVAGCGRQGQQASTAPVEVDGRQTSVRQLEKDSAKAEKVAQKGLHALTPAGMPSLLPASVGGYARTNVGTGLGPEPGMATASARYAKGGAAFQLRLVDFGAIGSIGAEPSAIGATSERKTATGYERVSTAGGRTITEQWDNQAKFGRYSIVAADRFSVSAEGAAESVDVLKAAVEAVNAARLRALAG